ncbi:MAG: 16S rRNA processing protein RimM [Sulfurovum sp.]|nr:16S rRNA processing protein RimM [Sulfurovum sp.]
MKNEQFFIAQIGRTIGLYGDLKLHLHTDFPEQFKVGAMLQSDKEKLEIESYNPTRGMIRFIGYSSIESAKILTNTKLYSTIDQTKENCSLSKGQHFWFDIIGLDIYENEEQIGTVEDIDRMLEIDYLLIKTDSKLVDEGHAKDFLLPYIPRYIISVDKESKKIYVVDAKDILEAS